MSRARLRQIERLLDLRGREAEAARGELALARRKTEEAIGARDTAIAAWHARAEVIADEPPFTVDEMIASRDHLEGLMRRARAAERAVMELEAEEEQRRAAVADADRELKKIELWRDRVEEAARAEATRRERIELDEIAARLAREET